MKVTGHDSLDVLPDGTLVLAMTTGPVAIRELRRDGTALGGFGTPLSDDPNPIRRRALRQALVVASGDGRIYLVPRNIPWPKVRQYDTKGELLREFPIEGEAIDIQSRPTEKLLQSGPQLSGLVIITGAAVDSMTNHLWVSMNGSSETGLVYEYTPDGRKVGEYRFKRGRGPISGVEAIAVRGQEVAIYVRGQGVYVFERPATHAAARLWHRLLGVLAVPPAFAQEACPQAVPATSSSVSCASGGSFDCRQMLIDSIASGHRIIGWSCPTGSDPCGPNQQQYCAFCGSASATACDPDTGVQTIHSLSKQLCSPTDPSGCGDPVGYEECLSYAGSWDYDFCRCDPHSPILLGLSDNAFQLTDATHGVRFDLNADGQRELVAWTRPGRDTGFLVLDRNNDGGITDGRELFGDVTEQPDSEKPNGFEALAVFDDAASGGNGDGTITRADSVFAALRVWIDQNHDGVTQVGELVTLPEAGVRWISLNYHESRRMDEFENLIRYRARVRGESDVSRWARDVFLRAIR